MNNTGGKEKGSDGGRTAHIYSNSGNLLFQLVSFVG